VLLARVFVSFAKGEGETVFAALSVLSPKTTVGKISGVGDIEGFEVGVLGIGVGVDTFLVGVEVLVDLRVEVGGTDVGVEGTGVEVGGTDVGVGTDKESVTA